MPLPHDRALCSVSADVAWVQSDERVVLVDLAATAAAVPTVCPEPAASLWIQLADRSMTVLELLDVAVSLAGEDAAEGLMEAFLEAFTAADLVSVTP